MGGVSNRTIKSTTRRIPLITDVRGCGFIQGIEVTPLAKDIIEKATQKGLLLIAAGDNVIRFVPPLIIGQAEIDTMIAILREALQELQE